MRNTALMVAAVAVFVAAPQFASVAPAANGVAVKFAAERASPIESVTYYGYYGYYPRYRYYDDDDDDYYPRRYYHRPYYRPYYYRPYYRYYHRRYWDNW